MRSQPPLSTQPGHPYVQTAAVLFKQRDDDDDDDDDAETVAYNRCWLQIY